MKFVTFAVGGWERVGIWLEAGIMPLPDQDGYRFETMLDLIEKMQIEWMEELEQRLASQDYPCLPVKDVLWRAPIPFPRRNVFCLGKNYAEHVREIKIAQIADNGIPAEPIYFTKIASPALAHGDQIRFSLQTTSQVDYEVELAVVIGREGINIKPEEAEQYIFGYTIINDVSARDLQANRLQWFKGKSLDTFCPMGPALVHKQAIPVPGNLRIQCRVNGELRQDSNTRNLIFDIPTIISDLSQGLTLKAGDIICTGTPSGVGMGFDPPKYLQDGDTIECYIEKIGRLVNTVAVI